MLEEIPRPPIEDILLSSIVLPPGWPKWITAESVRETIWVWQPFYEQDLTVADAMEIEMNVPELIVALVESGHSDPTQPRMTRQERRQQRPKKRKKLSWGGSSMARRRGVYSSSSTIPTTKP